MSNLFGLLEFSSNIWLYFGVDWFVGNIVVYVCWICVMKEQFVIVVVGNMDYVGFVL
jgi:hypothetical protein